MFVDAILAHPNGHVYAGTRGCGVYRSVIIPSTGLAETALSAYPSGISLGQNYPNPFNPITRISYSLSKSGTVKLSIYNAPGEKIGEWVYENQQAGYHNIQFDGSQLTNGCYYYRIKTENFSAVQKMLLIK